MARKSVFNDQQRILRLYSQLISKRQMSMEDITDMFFVSNKTVQRDIKNIRLFLADLQADEQIQSEIIFDRASNTYQLTKIDHLFEVFDKVNGLYENNFEI